jgi:hypothetical protein
MNADSSLFPFALAWLSVLVCVSVCEPNVLVPMMKVVGRLSKEFFVNKKRVDVGTRMGRMGSEWHK